MDSMPMTQEGHDALKAELTDLKSQMPAISKAIGLAMEEGDLKENAEYHAQKEKQGMLQARINMVEDALVRAEVIDLSQLGGDKVKFGATVTLENIDDGSEAVYRIVGSEEADIQKGSISVTSPVARALINREVGDEVKVRAPGGIRTYEIQAIDWK